MNKPNQTEFQKAVAHLSAGNFAVCCMKKRVEETEDNPTGRIFAVVFAEDRFTVHMRDVKGACRLTGEEKSYGSISEMLNDGWEVD